MIPRGFQVILCAVVLGTLPLTDTLAQSGQTAASKLFPHKPGIVSFTYRDLFAKDFAGTLDIVKNNGITDIEFSNLFGKSASEIRRLIDARGIKCSSFGVSYEDLMNKTAEVASNAQLLGAPYVRVAWIPHQGVFTLEDARKAIDDLNRVGKILLDQYSLHLVYHNHGYEFRPYGGGTLYDYLVNGTEPRYVNFELDILWAYFPGQNPARLISKYGSRYKMLHLKDLRKDVTGNDSGTTDQNNDVVLGQGQINIPQILRAAAAAKIEHYYLEDESSRSVTQVPQSIAYLESLPL